MDNFKNKYITYKKKYIALKKIYQYISNHIHMQKGGGGLVGITNIVKLENTKQQFYVLYDIHDLPHLEYCSPPVERPYFHIHDFLRNIPDDDFELLVESQIYDKRIRNFIIPDVKSHPKHNYPDSLNLISSLAADNELYYLDQGEVKFSSPNICGRINCHQINIRQLFGSSFIYLLPFIYDDILEIPSDFIIPPFSSEYTGIKIIAKILQTNIQHFYEMIELKLPMSEKYPGIIPNPLYYDLFDQLNKDDQKLFIELNKYFYECTEKWFKLYQDFKRSKLVSNMRISFKKDESVYFPDDENIRKEIHYFSTHFKEVDKFEYYRELIESFTNVHCLLQDIYTIGKMLLIKKGIIYVGATHGVFLTYYLSNKIEAFRITYQTSDPFDDGADPDINQCINLDSPPLSSPVFN